MIDVFYTVLEKIGYNHPLHPPLVHVPVGIVVGLLIVTFIALFSGRRSFVQSAHRPFVIIAFIAAFPVVLFGITDWQYFYNGAWLFTIKIKIALSGILLVLLGAGVFVARKGTGASAPVFAIYLACFFTMGALGYLGASLVFTQPVKQSAPRIVLQGGMLYEAQCRACHPDATSLSSSRYTASSTAFRSFLKKPSAGMPPFPDLSDDQIMQLYHFILRYPCEADERTRDTRYPGIRK